MTNPSDLAGDEMRAPTAEEVKFYAWRGPGYWGPRDQVNTDMVMMAREVERLRESADTIDRLTSTGEAVVTAEIMGTIIPYLAPAVSISEVREKLAAVLASPREGHVEVPTPETSERIGKWLSAALDDPGVCAEMKADINAWFAAGQPVGPVLTTYDDVAARAWDFVRPKLAALNKEKGPAGVWSNGFKSGWDNAHRAMLAAHQGETKP